MAKNSKHRLLFITVFFMVLLCSTACASLIGSVNAAEVTAREKGLSILSNVVGLDLARYGVATEEIQKESQTACVGVVPQDDVCFELMSSGSRLKTLCTFVNGRLQMIHVLESEGQPNLNKIARGANAVEMAKAFLKSYQSYTADALYGELESTLDNVEANENITKTSGNTWLEVSFADGYTTFKWTYTFNGIKAPSKFMSLGFNNGFLTYFVDNWQLYKIGSTNVNLSEKEAKAIALETAKTYTWSLKLNDDTFKAESFNESNVHWATLLFDCSLWANKTRNEDQLMLYPVWRVGVALDKWYGQLYGIEVDIWADTKEIRYVQEAWSTMPPPEEIPNADIRTVEASTGFTWITLPIVACAVAVAIFFWANSRRNLNYCKLLRPRFLKTVGMLLCTLLFMSLMGAIALVNATQAGARVWGSESSGAIDPSTGQSWRKHQTEIFLQQVKASNIASYFAQAGYDSVNHQGSLGSWKSQILNDITYLNYYYDYAAVVDFDHGVYRNDYPAAPEELHYLFEDNIGTAVGPTMENFAWHPENGVYDIDVHTRIASGKISFAFINTCLSADITHQGTGTYGVIGLPLAWTHRYVRDPGPGFNVVTDISRYGYHVPDDGAQCYIGFPSGSASLMQRIPYDYGNFYCSWVEYFFYYALMTDMSVHDALDHASLVFYGYPFGSCPLWEGFTCYWWNTKHENETMPGCTMAVYGNANIHLRILPPPTHHWLSVTAADDPSGYPLNPNVYVDGQWVGTTPVYVWVQDGWHYVQVDNCVWNDYLQCYDYFWWFNPGNSNPEYIQVSLMDTYTTAYYQPQQ
ncbi:MAG: hypothetical protein NWE94_07325 [Candidatus Bathyarchaeota archaeon]|nr:hypothetical protein [Candidatus Bathyarchaeota archaeon]